MQSFFTLNLPAHVSGHNLKALISDGSPGLVIIGGDSCNGFEFHHLILDGYFSHIFVLKIVMVV